MAYLSAIKARTQLFSVSLFGIFMETLSISVPFSTQGTNSFGQLLYCFAELLIFAIYAGGFVIVHLMDIPPSMRPPATAGFYHSLNLNGEGDYLKHSFWTSPEYTHASFHGSAR
jgi:hypothetical protein